MQSKRESLIGSVVVTTALLVLMLPSGARLNAKQAAAQSEEPVPAYHAQPPTAALPETMDPTQFDNPVSKKRLRAGRKSKESVIPAALLLPLRPGARSRQLA